MIENEKLTRKQLKRIINEEAMKLTEADEDVASFDDIGRIAAEELASNLYKLRKPVLNDIVQRLNNEGIAIPARLEDVDVIAEEQAYNAVDFFQDEELAQDALRFFKTIIREALKKMQGV